MSKFNTLYYGDDLAEVAAILDDGNGITEVDLRAAMINLIRRIHLLEQATARLTKRVSDVELAP